MLCSTSPEEALVACPPTLPWNLSFFTVESILSILCSRSDLFLTRQNAGLAHVDSLPSHGLLLWTDGSVTFLSGIGVLAY